VAVIVLVHPVEDVLCPLVCGVCGLHGAGSQHVVDGLYDLCHFLLINDPVAVHVVHPEGPFQLLLRGARRRDVDREEELPEVDEAVLVRVEGSEDMVAELLGVAAREEQLVHVHKLGRGQPTVGAVLLEPLVPLLDRVLVVAGVGLEELEVLLGQTLLGLDAPHHWLITVL